MYTFKSVLNRSIQMAKKKKDPRTVTSGIAERQWPVYGSYLLKIRNMPGKGQHRSGQKKVDLSKQSALEYLDVPVIVWDFMAETDGEQKSYSLSDPGIYEDLLLEYTDIRDEQSALKYVRDRGFPGQESLLPIQVWPVDELVDSAAYLRWLMRLADEIKNENMRVLNNYIKIIPSRWGIKQQIEIIVCDPSSEGIHPFETKVSRQFSEELIGESCMPVRRDDEESFLYMSWEWEEYGSKRSLYATQRYLLNAVNRLLVGVQPILTWMQTLDGKWVLGEAMLVNTPWQAIGYGLLLHTILEGNLRACKNGCGKRFQSRRSDKHFCSDKCRQAYNKKYRPSVHSYPRQNDGE